MTSALAGLSIDVGLVWSHHASAWCCAGAASPEFVWSRAGSKCWPLSLRVSLLCISVASLRPARLMSGLCASHDCVLPPRVTRLCGLCSSQDCVASARHKTCVASACHKAFVYGFCVPQDQVDMLQHWLWREPAAAASHKTLTWSLSLCAAPLCWLWQEPAVATGRKTPAGSVQQKLRYDNL